MQIFDDQLIVVTGGAGFIGSCVIKHLNDKGLKNILVVDELGFSDKWKNLVGKKFLEIIDPRDFFDWLEGKQDWIEAFIHLGACSDTTETDADFLLENNYRYSVKLAEYALKHEIRFIYASSAATYGDGQRGFSDSHDLLENYHPLNMYGFSKHLFDLWIKNQGVLDHVVGLKYFNVYGPNEGHKGRMASAITHLLPQVKKEGVVKLFKSDDLKHHQNGEQKRDFIYVKDAAFITCSFLGNDANGIFNVGTGHASSWNELAHALFMALGKESKIEYIEMPEDLKGKYQNYTCATVDKLKHALGTQFSPVSLSHGVKEYVQEYLLKQRLW